MKRICFVLFCIGTSVLSAQTDLEKADRLARNGQNAEAILCYRRYLENRQAQSDYVPTLIKASLLEPNIEASLRLVLLYDKKVTTDKQKKELFHYIGLLQEYLGNFVEAVSAYQEAFVHSSPRDYSLYLRIGFFALDTGETEKALTVASTVLEHAIAANLRLSAIVLSLLAFASTKNLQAGLRLIKKEQACIEQEASSVYYYALYRFYYANGEQGQAQKTKKLILTSYPDSAEALLLQSKIKLWPSPMNLFF